MISVRVNLTAREGKQLELSQAIGEVKDKIALEKGCIRCRVFEGTDDDGKFIMLQEWESEKLARAHLDSENFAVMVGAGSVLAHEVSVSFKKEPSIDKLEKSFIQRMEKTH